MAPKKIGTRKKTKTANPFAHFFASMLQEQGAPLGRSRRNELMREAGVRWKALTLEEKTWWKSQIKLEAPGGVSPDAAVGPGVSGEVEQVVPLPATVAREPWRLDSHETRFGGYVSFHGSRVLA